MDMKRSDTILMEYYENELSIHGRPKAVDRLKQVIVKGIDILVRNPDMHKTARVQNIMRSVRQGRHNEMIEGMTAQVQDTAKIRDGSFLPSVQVGGKELFFLPDVDIPNSEENQKQWRAFLQRLDPSVRVGTDPKTGLEDRIPFRDGAWLTDLIFIPQAAFNVVHDATRVNGDVHIYSLEAAQHPGLSVQGSLHMPVGLLGLSVSPIKKISGDLYLYDNDQTTSARDLTFGPEALMHWGLSSDRLLILNSGAAYLLQQENGEQQENGLTKFFLEEQSSCRIDGRAPRFVWTSNRWRQVGVNLPIEFANTVRMKIGRIRVHLGLAGELLPNHTDFNVDNLEKISCYLELCKTATLNGEDALNAEEKSIVHHIQEDVSALADLCMIDEVPSDEEIARRKGQIDTILDVLDENRLRAMQNVCKKPRNTIDRKILREDSEYLAVLSQRSLNVDDVLRTAGKTLVFFNNTFLSTRIRKKAASKIAPLRNILREIGENDKHADALLIELLKWGPDEIIPYLHKRHKEKLETINQLESKIIKLDNSSPKDVVEDFIRMDFGETSPALDQDISFLKHLNGISMGSLDQLFERSDGSGYETDRLRNAMWVNMRSIMIDDVRRKRPEFEKLKPSQIVVKLQGKAETFDPIVKAFNSLSSGI
ncbi:MAG: hypothetical protein ACNI3A_05230 [Desulfovibrio sp.]|uniref:hypothetical protein n=1 Tax=Desulfovibrio sp. 7SRBS1 TaxID=3378064 RepID=UPI003B3D918F